MLVQPADVEAFFHSHSLGTKLFVRARQRLFPFAQVLERVPQNGRVLDLGCGHGVFSLLVAKSRPQAEVVGVDPDVKKIGALERAASRLDNLRSVCGRLEQLAEAEFDCAALLDVLIYLPLVKQIDLLAQVRERLKPDGLLLLAMNDTRPRWKFAMTYMQERCMTWSRLTRAETLHFVAPETMASSLRDIGFHPEIVPLPTRGIYPHVLLIGRRCDRVAAGAVRSSEAPVRGTQAPHGAPARAALER
ncbi:MAG: class I SAM-dependent methyltransferase [Planctomycetota bacterium]